MTGTVDWTPDKLTRFVLERDPTRCWEWQGYIDPDGYGRYSGLLAHRLVYADERGPIPTGLQLDHLCRNRACVNPDHLEPVTHQTNQHRGMGFSGVNARKTHCKHGHEFTDANTYLWRNSRICRACSKIRKARDYRARPTTHEAAPVAETRL